ncbi:MAG: SPASM domain-containing protein [Bryobacterales bacterium]|nr:SPASM domain-containing protein [Bryobacterales bacterium]
MAFHTLALMLGYRCNARCRCCLWGDELSRPDRLDVEEAKGWIDQAGELGACKRLGFSGGESFLYAREMLALSEYAHAKYQSVAVASTNAYWAKSLDKAREALLPLRQAGMGELLVSADEFHQEYVPLDNVRHALDAARALGIACTVQTIVTAHSRRLADLQQMLGLGPDGGIQWAEIHCTRTGWAATRIPASEFVPSDEALQSYCSMLRPIIVRPDGGVFLCCGATFAASALQAGNLRQEPLKEILERAEWDALFNSLALANGPLPVAQALGAAAGHLYSTSCEACQHLLSIPGAAGRARKELEPRQAELFLKRNILEQEDQKSLAELFRL